MSGWALIVEKQVSKRKQEAKVIEQRPHRTPHPSLWWDGAIDKLLCTVSPLRVSRILLHCSGETVHGNLSKYPILQF